jgi:hypothetical protein
MSRSLSIRGLLFGLLALVVLLPAARADFVTYRFSGHDPDLPVAGSLTFSSDMPRLPPDDSFWIDYQPSGVATVRIGAESWSNATAPEAYCSVWIHYGWIQIKFWCPASEGGMPASIIIDFWASSGNNLDWDPDPAGPFSPGTYGGYQVRGSVYLPDPLGGVLHEVSLDQVTIAPYVDEPPALATLLSMGLAWALVRLCRRAPVAARSLSR